MTWFSNLFILVFDNNFAYELVIYAVKFFSILIFRKTATGEKQQKRHAEEIADFHAINAQELEDVFYLQFIRFEQHFDVLKSISNIFNHLRRVSQRHNKINYETGA